MNIKHLQVYKSDLEVLFRIRICRDSGLWLSDINGQEQAIAPTSKTQFIILDKTNDLV